MKNTQVWIAFISCIALVVMWFTIDSSYKAYKWVTQTTATKPVSIEWSVEQQTSDRFALAANYIFLHKGNEIKGKTLFQSKRYKNSHAADHFLDQHIADDWTIRYSPFQPQNSTINRFFPLKSCIYTAIVWCILLYFVWLSYYVGKHYQ